MSADKPSFFDIRNKIMSWEGLSLSTRVLWEHLCQMSWADGSCYPSNQALAKILGISLRQVIESKNELAEKRLINVFRRNRPQTTLIFPFVQFKNIDQRDKNIITFNSAVSALPDTNKNSNLQTDSADSAFDQCSECTTNSAVSAPIKENIKIKYKREEVQPSVVCDERSSEHEHVTAEPVKTKAQLKREKAEARKEQRESQLAEIRLNLQTYKTDYPDIDLDDLFRRLDFWLHNDPTGKTRLDIRRTWRWWLNKEQSKIAMRNKFNNKNKPKREFDPEEYKRYVTNTNT